MKKNTPEEQRRLMLDTPIRQLIVRLAIPAVATQLITVVYNTADMYFVSKISTAASAAVGIVFSLQSLIHALAFGIGMGTGTLLSRYLGCGDDENAQKCTSSGVVMSLGTGFLITGLCLAFLEPLMRLLGSTDTILPYSIAYAKYIVLASPVMCLQSLLGCVLRNSGRSTQAMIGVCAGGIINTFLDPLFISVFNMGTAGAAIATAVSQIISTGVLVAIFLMGKAPVKINPKYASRNFKDYWQILATGSPTIFRQGLACISTACLNVAAADYSDAAIAAISIANKVYMLVRGIIIGVGQGYMPVAAFNYAAGKKKRTREAFYFTTIMGTAVCIVFAVVISIFPEAILRLFRDDADVIAAGKPAVLFVCAVMPFLAYSTFVNQTYQGLGFKIRATILASSRQGICFLPLIFILPRFLGLTGIQLSQPGADFLTFIISIPFQLYFFKNNLKE